MFCRNCGKKIKHGENNCPNCSYYFLNSENFCQNCGFETKPEQQNCSHCNACLIYIYTEPKATIDEPNIYINIISALCYNPIIGIILYIIWNDDKPKSAKSVCKWTIIGFFITNLVVISYFVIAFLLGYYLS